MSRRFGTLFLPSRKQPFHPWVLLQEASPKWRNRGRYRTEEEAQEAATRWLKPGDTLHRIVDDEPEYVR